MNTQSDQINELAAALSKCQGEIKSAIKDGVNPHFKNKYASLGSCWDACRLPLSKNGLSVMQQVETIGVDIFMITTLAHASGQWMKSSMPLLLSKRDMQGLGAACTYARRFSLCALVGIDGDLDDDGESAVGRGKSTHEKHEKPTNNVVESHISPTLQPIGKDKLEEFLITERNIDETCRKNMNAHLLEKFDITPKDYHFMTDPAWQVCMKAMSRNIEMNAKKAVES